MDESEKRRERLKAIRMGAAQAEVHNSDEIPLAPNMLSNPLIEPFENSPVQSNIFSAPRFDYYTDPLSAFSGNRMSNLQQDQFLSPRPGNPPMTHFPHSQFGNNFSPDQTVHHSHGPLQTPHAHMNHLRMDNSFPVPVQHGTPGSSESGNISSHNPGAFCSPGFSSSEARGLMGRHGSGRGSPSPNSVRGKGRWSGNSGSPSLGRSGQRGSRPCAEISALDQPELFYNRSMMEDPWESLTPLVWNPLATGSWLPRSISMKKARVKETPSKVNLQSSLAEYLAASFNEAADATEHQLD